MFQCVYLSPNDAEGIDKLQIVRNCIWNQIRVVSVFTAYMINLDVHWNPTVSLHIKTLLAAIVVHYKIQKQYSNLWIPVYVL